MQKPYTCIWSKNRAQEAAEYYVSVFKNSKILATTYYGDYGAGERRDTDGNDIGQMPAGTVLTVMIEINGQKFMVLNGGVDAEFNYSMSIVAPCDDQAEMDAIWEKMLKDGGTAQQCGWFSDKFGVNWQIWAASLEKKLLSGNQKKNDAMMIEMFKMVKLDIARLEKAWEEG